MFSQALRNFMEKPPDDVRTAVADRPRRVLEMDFGAWDEEIGQELTEGKAFWTRPWFLCEFRVSSLFGARSVLVWSEASPMGVE